MSSMNTRSVNTVDQRLSTLAVLLEPVCTLARVLGLSLDDLQRMLAVAYFREYRQRGLSLPAVARHLGKSERTVAKLSKESREEGSLEGSRRLQLQRDVVRLGSIGPVDRETVGRLQPRLDATLVDDLLGQMELAGLVEETEAGWVTVAEHIDMVSTELEARLDSLRHFLTSVAHLVYARFFKREPEASAFARVWTFTGTRAGLDALERETYERLRASAIALDGEDTDAKKLASVLFALVEPPDDIAWKPRRGR
ncbi:MAG TPA: hypothetical protein DEF51_48610 [Myxococcales bacterium]|nr:hypothetical protein [Myxococcales bacterium]